MEQTPDDFVFALKASRYLTHVKRLTEMERGVASWFVPEVYALLRKHGAALIIGDHPERPFQTHELTADWTFIRFHQGRRGRRGSYSESELRTWQRRISQWRRRVEVYAYFNNDWEAFAVRNARRLKAMLGEP